MRTLLAPKSILVVEDDPLVADTVRLLLTVEGHQVEIASDGVSALAKHNEGKHDMVVTDFSMPGIDGLDLAALIKARTPGKPILLVTAYAETLSSNEKARMKYVDGLLAKPFSRQELQDALRAVFPNG